MSVCVSLAILRALLVPSQMAKSHRVSIIRGLSCGRPAPSIADVTCAENAERSKPPSTFQSKRAGCEGASASWGISKTIAA